MVRRSYSLYKLSIGSTCRGLLLFVLFHELASVNHHDYSKHTTPRPSKKHGYLKLIPVPYLTPSSGSFGTYPRAIRSVLRSFQDLAEARPDSFIRYQYPTHLNASRAAVAEIINAPPKTVVFVPNATTGFNTVLRNLHFEEGDHIVYFTTIYKGCDLTVQYITETTPAKAVKVEYTYPVEDDWLVEAFKTKVQDVQKAGGKVKVAIFDTVVSMPGVRVPFEHLTKACKELGVLSLVDAAHGIGHVELDMQALDPDFLLSNCHK